ncbi:hypothetical protein NKR23_g3284 [Pleurostoma richardsiae]|uniref:Uncharacterized protein n=1 Tax=Pleurostoma richardsiae TaxID=41990 RepID=A0AA38VX71_9PEZI|nr:hypothetical protein NKR23_g3284 [Pleurostoma richardsiae]
MLSLQDIVAFLQSRIMALSLVPDEYASVVRLISWFFLTLGLATGIPIASLIVFDFFLWIYRLNRPKPPRKSQRRQSLSHPVTT